MHTEPPLLKLENFCCIRNDRPLFSPLSLSLNRGEIIHLRSANGVGKTSLIRAIYGLSIETLGQMFWCNLPVTSLMDKANYLNDGSGFISRLTVAEALEKMLLFTGQAANPKDLQLALQQVGLKNPQMLSETLSKGQKKRLHIARLLLVDRPLWLLDELFDGLDQPGEVMLQHIMDHFLNKDGAIIYTSHLHNTETAYRPGRSVQLQQTIS